MNTVILSGVKCLADYETMPEWRLDEIAWETGCLYDYKADIDSKRQWIKNAIALYSIFGTPKAAKQFPYSKTETGRFNQSTTAYKSRLNIYKTNKNRG